MLNIIEELKCYFKYSALFRLSNGGEYLFQCKDNDEMNQWVAAVNSAVGGEAGAAGTSQTMPAGVAGPSGSQKKKQGFFTLGKK